VTNIHSKHGLDVLTKTQYLIQTTRPKQLGSTCHMKFAKMECENGMYKLE
jgi:hypothetical protein